MVKDALLACPDTHKKLFENDEIRVLVVEIEPGHKEHAHTHDWQGVMVVTSPAKLRFYNEQGEVEFEGEITGAEWRDPISGSHTVENVDSRPFKAYRVELKK